MSMFESVFLSESLSFSTKYTAATSALDSASEHHVKEAIDSAMKGRTVLSIAHRLSTIQQSDRIAVLKDGVIAEVGTYLGTPSWLAARTGHSASSWAANLF